MHSLNKSNSAITLYILPSSSSSAMATSRQETYSLECFKESFSRVSGCHVKGHSHEYFADFCAKIIGS